jgi:deoxyribodipyrimidine photolyase
MVNGWTLERRARQAELIRTWKPWEQSTGPKSAEGRLRVGRNAWTGGHRAELRELSKLVNAEIRQAREMVAGTNDSSLSPCLSRFQDSRETY